MKYCTVYHQHLKAPKAADEIIINYTNDIKNLISFLLNKCSRQRVIIQIIDFENFIKVKEIEKIKIIKQTYPDLNFALLIPSIFGPLSTTADKEKVRLIQICQENKIPYFTEDRCGTWDKFYILSQLGVTDIYVVEALGFNLPTVSKIAHSRSISLRTFANVAQFSVAPLPAKLHFFIRPEDIPFYSQYIDTIEFFKGKELDVLYDIYTKDERWGGNLQEIINGLPEPIYSNYLFPGWPDRRIECDRKCMKGDNCSLCDNYISIANQLKEMDIKKKESN